MRRVAIALALVLVAACGVQDDSGPRALAPEDVPFGLLDPATSVANPENAEGTSRAVWFVDNDGLLARGDRRLESPVTVADIVRALLEGVSDAEAANGLRSNIASGTELLGADGPKEGLVTIDLSGEILTVSRESQRLAIAQVVFTATGLPSVDRVLFKFDGTGPAEVPGAGDELTSEPLRRRDFSQFDPTATTTTIVP